MSESKVTPTSDIGLGKSHTTVISCRSATVHGRQLLSCDQLMLVA